MRAVVRWAIRNSPSMNTLMIATLVVGVGAMLLLRRETFPAFDVDMVLVSVPYPGASPAEVEQGICQKVEEAVRPINGVKKVTAVASEGAGSIVCELRTDVKDSSVVLDDIRSAVDRIPSFPESAEDPEVKLVVMRTPAVRVSLVGPVQQNKTRGSPSSDSDEGTEPTASSSHEPRASSLPETAEELARRRREERRLRDMAEQVRDELLQLSTVSNVEMIGARPYQIDVEIPEQTLRKFGLSLGDVAQIIRSENVDLPGGSIRTESTEFLVRGRNKRLVGEEIAELPLLSQPGGVVLTVGDLGTVRDGFEDVTRFAEVNGRPAVTLEVRKTDNEDLLAIVEQVRAYMDQKQLPAGYELLAWDDRSIVVRDRLEMLTYNGLGGLLLVFLTLSIFLNIRLAFWVALGIPISVLGTCAIMLGMGATLNMLTMFAFIMGLGIVVDDAIVIGENIYSHRQRGKTPIQAAIDGTWEVAPSVAASVATTIIAFAPLCFVSGVFGKFMAIMPVAVIAMLAISLVESLLILPCHLAHTGKVKQRGWHQTFRRRVDGFVDYLINRLYLPSLRLGLAHPYVIYSAAVMSLAVSLGLIAAGFTPFDFFPKLDGEQIRSKIAYPDGTPADVTDQATQRLIAAIERVAARHNLPDGQELIRLRFRSVGNQSELGNMPTFTGSGSHIGEVWVELAPVEQRGELTSQQIIDEWREEAGEFPGVEELTFEGIAIGPSGKGIEFKLLGRNPEELEQVTELVKDKLSEYQAVYDVSDDSRPGKWELQLSVKPRAEAMGVQLGDLARTVRATYYGEEVMRLQRGRHEIKLMVRYPREERTSLANFEEIRVRTPAGAEIPLSVLADVKLVRGYSEINRVDQQPCATIMAEVDGAQGNAQNIVADLKRDFLPELLAEHPSVSVRWEGRQEQLQESMGSLYIGFVVALFLMFSLLTMEFRSYAQPLIILAVIPFGMVGAVAGHLSMGLDFTIFSIFGIVALSGVVANDSIVLVDFINHRREDGIPLFNALVDAGAQRFRPVMLTSVTTVAGLLPILLERSLQAQVLIPMAVSLAFGLMAATLWVLFLVPALYQTYANRLTRLDDEEQAMVDVLTSTRHVEEQMKDSTEESDTDATPSSTATAYSDPRKADTMRNVRHERE